MNTHEQLVPLLKNILRELCVHSDLEVNPQAIEDYVDALYAALVFDSKNMNNVAWIKKLREDTEAPGHKITLYGNPGPVMAPVLASQGMHVRSTEDELYVLFGRKSMGLKEAKDFYDFARAAVRDLVSTPNE